MVDTNDDTNRDEQNLRDATIQYAIPDENDPEMYLVEFPSGATEYVPATYHMRLLLEDDLYDRVDGENTFDVGPVEVSSVVNIERDYYKIVTSDGYSVGVPEERLGEFVGAFTSHGTGEKLYDMFLDIADIDVRRNVVDEFIGTRFEEDRVEAGVDGWVVDDTFLVDYEANNYLVEDHTVYIPTNRGDPTGVVEADEKKEAVTMSFPSIDGTKTIYADGVGRVRLDESEQEFLATVEALLHPEKYLDAELVKGIETLREYEPNDGIESFLDGVGVKAFTDARSHVHHSHDMQKHRLSEEFNVSQQAIDEMYSAEYDHLALHEMVIREPEFRSAEFNVFTDTHNRDDERWEEIKEIQDKAPVSAEDISKLQEMFEDTNVEVVY